MRSTPTSQIQRNPVRQIAPLGLQTFPEGSSAPSSRRRLRAPIRIRWRVAPSADLLVSLVCTSTKIKDRLLDQPAKINWIPNTEGRLFAQRVYERIAFIDSLQLFLGSRFRWVDPEVTAADVGSLMSEGRLAIRAMGGRHHH